MAVGLNSSEKKWKKYVIVLKAFEFEFYRQFFPKCIGSFVSTAG